MTAPRKIVQIAAATENVDGENVPVIVALADDGTVWTCTPDIAGETWAQVDSLPAGNACGANVDRHGDMFVCELLKGHSTSHYSAGLGFFP